MDSGNTHPFTSADALAAGVTKGDLRSGRFRQVFRGVHVDAGVEDSLDLRARAALLLHPEGACLSHTTAAALLGLPVDSDDIHVSGSASQGPAASRRHRQPRGLMPDAPHARDAGGIRS